MNDLFISIIAFAEIALLIFAVWSYDSLRRQERVDSMIEANPQLSSFQFTEEELSNIPGQKLLEIKLVRERTGLDLRDAYSIVDYHSRRATK